MSAQLTHLLVLMAVAGGGACALLGLTIVAYSWVARGRKP